MTDKLELPKTPNPLKQARRDKREARAIRRFIKDYRDARRGYMTPDEREIIRVMLETARVYVRVSDDVLAALKADEVKA